MDESASPRLTYKVQLPGGQVRLREAALYVMQKCVDADFFGLTKLNKILWRADFQAYARRHVPVTGRQYNRLQHGPAPVEMLPILQELQRDGHVTIETRQQGVFEERRPVAHSAPSLRYFSVDDLSYLDDAIASYSGFTAKDVSEDSHGVAWETRHNGDPMPYELSFLSNDPLTAADAERFAAIGKEQNWQSA